jgi:hypothetical protein
MVATTVPQEEPVFIRRADAGRISGTSDAYWAKLSRLGIGPRVYKLSHSIALYNRAELLDWIAQHASK